MNKLVTMFILLVIMALPVSTWALNPAPYDTVSIHDLQYVPDPGTSQFSPYYGDTVVVRGIVQHDIRELWVGARWACYITDGTTDPWSGFFIIQNDTFAVNTLFGFAEPGEEYYFTGVVDEYTGLSQIALLTDPVVPITFVSDNNPLPAPKVLTCADLATHAAGEQWESMNVRLENLTVTGTGGSNQAFITDGTGTTSIDDYFWYFREQFNNGGNPWPPTGTNLNLEGYTRDIDEAYFSVCPRDDSAFEILTNPPEISNVRRDPGVPKSNRNVTVFAAIVDNIQVQTATLHYSVDWGAFTKTSMNITSGDTFAAAIPTQSDNSYVRYFITAVDNDGDSTQAPGDTADFVYSYVIRDAGLSIKDVQYTWGYSGDASPFDGYEVTLEGVVSTDPTDWPNNYYIQSKDSAWYGMWVYDTSNAPAKGDLVSVTGTADEYYGVTQVYNVTAFSVVTPGVGAFDPIQVTTGEIATGGANAEAYEDVLVKVVNVTVTDPFPDAPGNYGEFAVDDGSGELRVDDSFSAFSGNLDTTFTINDQIQELIGVHYYSFGDYKLLPRDTNDVVGHVVGIEDEKTPVADNFQLDQNYPNPFNPVTKIRFSIPEVMPVKLEVFNILGQKVRTLYDGSATMGSHTLQWNGRNDAGQQLGSGIYFYQLRGENLKITKKMILMK